MRCNKCALYNTHVAAELKRMRCNTGFLCNTHIPAEPKRQWDITKMPQEALLSQLTGYLLKPPDLFVYWCFLLYRCTVWGFTSTYKLISWISQQGCIVAAAQFLLFNTCNLGGLVSWGACLSWGLVLSICFYALLNHLRAMLQTGRVTSSAESLWEEMRTGAYPPAWHALKGKWEWEMVLQSCVLS